MTNREVAVEIVKRLRKKGFEALLAGGCVRDMLLRRPAKDYDVATSARPKDVMKSFRRTLKVGVKFGVVIVLVKGRKVEVTTFRTDSDYVNGRHPAHVKFVGAEADASRRDFTINGMFYDPVKKKVIDYVDGRADLKRRLIRTIGNPEERFREDYLRMLRAVRFSTQLGFAIERRTKSAIRSNAKNITKISGERKRMELEGILVSPNRCRGVSFFIECGLAEVIFPGLSSEDMKSAVRVLEQLRKKVSFPLGLAGFFSSSPTKLALENCHVLKLSRNETRHVKYLLVNRGALLDEEMSLGRLKMMLGEPYFRDMYELQRAIQKAAGGDSRAVLSPLIKLHKRIRALGDVDLRPKALLNGREMIRLGAVPSPALGQLAEETYIAQLEGILQTKSQAKQWVLKWLEEHRRIEKEQP